MAISPLLGLMYITRLKVLDLVEISDVNLIFREWLLRVFLNSGLFGVSQTVEPGMEVLELIAGS